MAVDWSKIIHEGDYYRLVKGIEKFEGQVLFVENDKICLRRVDGNIHILNISDTSEMKQLSSLDMSAESMADNSSMIIEKEAESGVQKGDKTSKPAIAIESFYRSCAEEAAAIVLKEKWDWDKVKAYKGLFFSKSILTLRVYFNL